MHISFQALVLVGLSLDGALAQPAHRHQHKHRRDLADVLDKRGWQDVNFLNLGWAKICAGGGCDSNKAAAAPERLAVAPVSSAVVAPTASSSAPASSAVAPSSSPSGSSTPSTSGSSSGSSTGSCNNLASVWDKQSRDSSRDSAKYLGDGSNCPGGCTSAHGAPFSQFADMTTPANVGTTDSYRGNVGSTYGHNMYPLSDCNVSGQNYSITFTNADSEQIYVAIWNKVGDDYNIPDRKQTGQSRNAFWKFPLAAGQSAAFAVQENSQIAFSQACGRRGDDGAFDCTIGEADFGDLNTPNNGWSGYDRSSIPNGKGNTGLLTVCADGHGCSSKETHSFVSASQTDAGGDLSIPPGPAHIKVTMGG